MTKQYQVFVSSTYQDLSDERLEVIKALLELDCIPCGMEYFPAASEETWIYIASLIDQCDYYIVIVGGRYGSLTTEGVSFTQREYEYAVAKGVPAMSFIHANPLDLPAKRTEPDEVGRKKLAEFVTHLKRHLCKEWSSSHELGAVVSKSLTQLIKRQPRVGWVPANQANNPHATQEILELTKQVRQLESELEKARGKRVIDAQNLSDGDEVIELAFTFSVLKEDPDTTYRRYIADRYVATSIRVSWNELFRIISPKIAPTANDTSIKNWFNAFITARYQVPRGELKKDEQFGTIALDTDSFHVIKIQFSALGLITVAKEKTGDAGKSSLLWRLTEKGEQRMYQTLAVRKSS